MSTRRGFFALIGNAAVSGLVMRRASATTPTLILPAAFRAKPLRLPAGPSFPLLAGHASQMDAFCHIEQMVPAAEYYGWIEGGLRVAKMYNGRSEDETERHIEAMAAKHGGIIAAIRAGAI